MMIINKQRKKVKESKRKRKRKREREGDKKRREYNTLKRTKQFLFIFSIVVGGGWIGVGLSQSLKLDLT